MTEAVAWYDPVRKEYHWTGPEMVLQVQADSDGMIQANPHNPLFDSLCRNLIE